MPVLTSSIINSAEIKDKIYYILCFFVLRPIYFDRTPPDVSGAP